jgi:hypothetical protein
LVASEVVASGLVGDPVSAVLDPVSGVASGAGPTPLLHAAAPAERAAKTSPDARIFFMPPM